MKYTRVSGRALRTCMAAAVLPVQAVAQVQLEQATYIGGSAFDRAQGCATDEAGFVYIAGNTRSADMTATPGSVQPANAGNQDAFVAKFSPDLKRLIALTYWGGKGEDRGYGVNVDAAGDIYLSGITKSNDFPTTPGAYDRTLDGDADVFLARFSPDLKAVRFSTLLGGGSTDNRDPDWTRGGLQLDGRNNVYLTGRTSGPVFPTTPGAFATTYAGGQHDAFVTKFSSSGSDLQWSTLIGGANGSESFYGNLVLHGDQSVFVAGYTNADDFPVTPDAFDRKLDGKGYPWPAGEGVVARIRADGSGLFYSTYLWGSAAGNDALAVDANGRAHVVANVRPERADYVPISPGAMQPGFGGGDFDASLAILSPDGRAVERATFLGGSGEEEGSGIALDSAGNIYTGGNTSSADFPVTTGRTVVQSALAGGVDAYFVVLDPQLGLAYATYLGGPGTDRIRCITHGPADRVVVSGDTDGRLPGVVGGYDAFYNGGRDGFIAIFSGMEAGGPGSAAPDAAAAGPRAPVTDLYLEFGAEAAGEEAGSSAGHRSGR